MMSTTINPSISSQLNYSKSDTDVAHAVEPKKAYSTGTEVKSSGTPFFVSIATQNTYTENSIKDESPGIKRGNVEVDPSGFSRQVSQLLSNVATMPSKQVAQSLEKCADELCSLASKSGFDIEKLANGFSGLCAATLTTIALAAQKQKQAAREQSNANIIVSRSHAESSASQIVQAGKEQKSMVDKQSGIGIGTSLLGAGIQMKGLSNSNKAISSHGSNSVSLKRKADSLSSMASPAKRLKSDELMSSDIKLLKSTSKELKHDSSVEGLHKDLRLNDASKLQMQGMMVGQNGQNIGGLASSNDITNKANAEALSQLRKNDQEVQSTIANEQKQEADSANELKKSLLQMLQSLLENRSSTVSAMTSNIRA